MKADLFHVVQFVPALVNHLWQSTAVFLLLWALTALLQRQRAALRFRLWMLASLKFLVPFSLLIAAGQHLRPAAPEPAPTQVIASVVTRTVEPYSGPVLPSQMLIPTWTLAPEVSTRRIRIAEAALALWAIGACAILALWLRTWLIGFTIARRATPWKITSGLRLRKTRGVLEPCIYGLFRPVLLLPEDLPRHLSVAEIDAILAHELCHVRRRDNLWAALHTLVTALFWFHPAVWIVRTRLLDERERACDESVVSAGNDRELYARSILNVCRIYAEAPAASMAGVTGGELTQRVVRIMSYAASARLSSSRKALLASLALILCGLPLTAGMLTARIVRAQDGKAPIPFEVFSIRPSKPDGPRGAKWEPDPDGYSVRGQNLWQTVMIAFYPGDFFTWKDDTIVNFPKASWGTEPYDIDGKIPTADMDRWKNQGTHHELLNAALRQALVERCHLAMHYEQHEHPVFALTLGKGTLKLEKFNGPDTVKDKTFPFREGWMGPGNEVKFYGISMASLADWLSNSSPRIVVDQTGLKGLYNITLTRLPRDKRDDNDPDPPSPFDVEALGLSLKSTRAMGQTIVIDHLEPPSVN